MKVGEKISFNGEECEVTEITDDNRVRLKTPARQITIDAGLLATPKADAAKAKDAPKEKKAKDAPEETK